MITFIDYQYKGIGGVKQIIVNTTLELNRRGKQTKIYCPQDSYEYKCLTERKAGFIYINSDEVSKENLSNYLDPSDVIVLTHIGESQLMELIKPLNNRIVFYSVHPDTFFVFNPILQFFCNQREAALDFVSFLDKNRGLLIMDGPNLKAIYTRGGNELENLTYLPLPVINYSNKHRVQMPKGENNVTYLGRGNEIWKIYPVVKILEDMNRCKIAAKLTVITDVNTLFVKMIRKYLPNNKIEVSYLNGLRGEELENYLINHSTLHIAMGTSALEGAKLGIPTIMIDYSKQLFPEYYKYRWLYECEDYCLGEEIKNGVLASDKGLPLVDVWNMLSNEVCYNLESEACHSYVEKHHSIKEFVDRLETACENTRMTSQLYCSTLFSRNLYKYQRSSLKRLASRIKRLIFGNPYEV